MGFDNRLRFEDIQEGDRLPEARLRMDRETYLAYNRLVQEINPLHFDQAYARRLGFREIVVAGVYTFSFIPKMVEDWVGDSGAVGRIDIQYRNPIYLGNTIVQKAHVRKKSADPDKKWMECEVAVEDEEGNPLTRAVVTVEFF